MTRSFLADQVPADTLDKVLDSARRVPSAGNTQGFDFVVLEGSETSRYWDVTLPLGRREKFRWQGLLRAPVLVTVWADAEGLGVLFFGMFNFAPKLAEVLGVPNTRVPIGTIALGWPDEADQELGRSTSIDRRPLEGDIASVVHRGHW